MSQLSLCLPSDEEIKAPGLIKPPDVIQQSNGFPSIITQAVWLPNQIR